MINLTFKTTILAIILLTAAFTTATFAAKLTQDEQKTANLCLQYLKKYPATHMPAEATPVLKWCLNNTESVCKLAENGLSKDGCETKLNDWDTNYVPPPPALDAHIKVPVRTYTPPPIPQVTPAPVATHSSPHVNTPEQPTTNTTPTDSTSTDTSKKSNQKKEPGINWF